MVHAALETRARRTPPTRDESPTVSSDTFWRLVADAERIDIEELHDPARAPFERSFLVRVSAPAANVAPRERGEREDRRTLLDNAQLLLETDDYVLARGIYSYLLRRDRNDAEALKGMGECFLALGNTASARRCFEALPELPYADERRCLLTRCWVAEGNDKKALETYREIRNPEGLPARHRLALWRATAGCLAREGKWDEAAECFRKALALRPNSDGLLVSAGLLELERGDLAAAERFLKRAVLLSPTSARAHYGLGLLECDRGAWDDAEKALAKALELDSLFVPALHQLILVAEHTGRFGLVKTKILAFLEKEPTHSAMRFALAAVRLRAGERAEAAAELRFILGNDPRHGRASELLAEIEPESSGSTVSNSDGRRPAASIEPKSRPRLVANA
jgi:tetratricopeptide (TPR) repeat protein